MNQKNMHEVNPQSYWGALGSMLILYCVGHFIFQGFVANIRSSVIIPMLLWFLFFFAVERVVTGRIKSFLDSDRTARTSIPRSINEIFKLIFTLAMLVPTTLLALGYYPFEKPLSSWWAPLLFNVFSFAVAWIITKSDHTSLKMAGGCGRIIGIFGCSIFILIGVVYPDVRYLAGVIGLECLSFLIISWLLEA